MFVARLRCVSGLLAAGLAAHALLVAILLGADWWVLEVAAVQTQFAHRAIALTPAEYIGKDVALRYRPIRLLRTTARTASLDGAQEANRGAAGSRLVGMLICLAGMALVASALLAWHLSRAWAGAADPHPPQHSL